MKMKGSIFFVASVLVTLGLSFGAPSQTQGSPGLSETIEWLKGKTDEIVGIYPLWVSSGDTAETAGYDSLKSRGRIAPEVSSYCNFSWHVIDIKEETPASPTPTPQPNTKKDNRAKSNSPGLIVTRSTPPASFLPTSVSFLFSELNPERIVVGKQRHRNSNGVLFNIGIPEDEWWVKVYATDKRKSVRWQNATDNQASNGFAVAFRTEEMAQRFAKALTHSVKLCGGKPDKKEPF